jgi:hypothetical protein
MTYQSIGLGDEADDGTGDALRVGGDKVNDNFVELYTLLGDASALSSGISATATVVTLTAPVISGTVSGDITVSGTFLPAGDTAASDNAAIGYTSAEGLILTGQGSTSDVTIKNDADATVISIATGTTNVTIAGDLTISGDDLTMGTNTSGAALIADGTNFNPVVISGDISINTSGVAAIGSGVIVVADMAANSIDSAQYVDGSIDNAHIADDAIDSEHYAAGSIDSAHLADDAVTLAKMAGGTDGNIISYDTSGNPVAVATGNDGQVLTSSGAGAVCAFEDAAGGGAWTLIGTAVASNSASLTITGLDSTYDTYAIEVSDILAGGAAVVYLRVGDSNGIDSGSDYSFHRQLASKGSSAYGTSLPGSDLSHIDIGACPTGSSGDGMGVSLKLHRPGDGTNVPIFSGTQCHRQAGDNLNGGIIIGSRNDVITLDRIQILFDTGNITSGRLTVWGIAHA